MNYFNNDNNNNNIEYIDKLSKDIMIRKQDIEHQIEELEDIYLERTQQYGNVVSGWIGYLDAKTPRIQLPPNAIRRDKKIIRPKDKIFSSSSISSLFFSDSIPLQASASMLSEIDTIKPSATFSITMKDKSLTSTTSNIKNRKKRPASSDDENEEDSKSKIDSKLTTTTPPPSSSPPPELIAAAAATAFITNKNPSEEEKELKAPFIVDGQKNEKSKIIQTNDSDTISIPSNRSSTPKIDPNITSSTSTQRRKKQKN